MYKPDDPYTLTYQTNYFKYLLWALQLLLSCCFQLITYCQDTTYVHRLSQSNTFVWVRNTAYVRLWTKLNVAKHVTEFCVWWQILFQQLMLLKITGLSSLSLIWRPEFWYICLISQDSKPIFALKLSFWVPRTTNTER